MASSPSVNDSAGRELRVRFPRYRVIEDGLRRVQMSNVAGFSHVPVEVLGSRAG